MRVEINEPRIKNAKLKARLIKIVVDNKKIPMKWKKISSTIRSYILS